MPAGKVVVIAPDEENVSRSNPCPVVCRQLLNGRDVSDAPPSRISFTWVDFIVLLFSIGSYLFDVGTDATLAYFYYTQEHYVYFGLTLAFVIIPSMTITGISFSWYQQDYHGSKENVSQSGVDSFVESPATKQRRPCWQLPLRLTLHILQMAPVARYIETMTHGLRSCYYHNHKRKRCFMSMLREDADACLLRLFEAFMESAPQLVLQVYILARNAQTIKIHYMIGFYSAISRDRAIADQLEAKTFVGKEDVFIGESSAITVIIQGVSVVASLVSLAWALTSYNRATRFTTLDKKNIDNGKPCGCGCMLYFLWRLGTVVARVLALALFASVFTLWAFPVCAVRWIIMSAWIIAQQPNVYPDNRCQEFLFCCAVGVIYVFSVLNVKDEPTRLKYLFYYTFDFVENTTLVALWFVFGDPFTWFYYPALVGQLGAFFLGVTFMMLYYVNFHPNGPQEICSFFRRPPQRSAVSYSLSSEMPFKALRRPSTILISQKFENVRF